MPNSWSKKKLADVCDVFTDGDWIEKKDQSSSGIRLIQTGNIGEGRFKNRPEKARFVSEDTFKRLKCTEVFPGDVLLSRLPEPVGRACIIPKTGQRMITAVDCTIIRPKRDAVLAQWIVYLSQSPSFLRVIEDRTTGTTRKRISRKNLGSVTIPVPSLSEQKRIVKILDETHKRLAATKTNVEMTIKNAQAVFENYINEEFTRSGDGRLEKPLGEVCDLSQGLAINAKTKHLLVPHSNLPLLRIKDLRNNTEEQFVAEEGYPPGSIVHKSDLIYTRTGQVGLVFRGRFGVLHNNSFKITPKGILSKDYLFWWLQHTVFRKRIIALASRAAQPDITHKLFKAQSIIIPSAKEQEKSVITIEKLWENVEKLKAVYRRKRSALDELNKSLLSEAFAGTL